MQIETGMENENEMVIKRLSVPLGLEELMENLTKEVLRRRPADVYAFASEHFAQLLALRDTGCYKTSFMKIKKTPSQVSAESLKGTQGAKQPPIKIKSAMLGTMEAAPKSLGNRKKLPSPRSKSIASDSPVLRSDRAKHILDKHMAKKQSAGDKSKIDPKGKAAVKMDGGQRKSGSKKATPQKDVQVKKSAKQIKALQTGEKKSQTKNDKAPPPVQGGGLKRNETETPKSNESEIPKGNEAETPKGNETGTPKGNEIEKPKGNEKESVKQNRIEIPGTNVSETSNGNETEPPKSNEVETPKENEKDTLNEVEIPGHNESETPKKDETKTPRGSDESEGPKEEAVPKMENAIGEELKADSKKETVSNNQELKQEANGQFGAKIENDDGVSASKQQSLDETNQNKNKDIDKAFEENVDDERKLTKSERDAKGNESESQGSVEDESKVITKEDAETKNDLKLNNGNIVKIVSEEKLTKEEKEEIETETEKGKIDASLDKKQENVSAEGKPKEMAANQTENNLKSEAVEEAQKDEEQIGITGDEASEQKIENAAVSIQAGWRGYQTRKRLQKTVEPKPGDLVNVAENENLQVSVDRTNANDIQAKQNETLLRQETVTISKDGVTEEFSAKTAAQTQLAPKSPSNLGEDAKSSVRNEVEKLEEQSTEGDATLSRDEEKEEKIIAQKKVELPEPLAIKKTEEDEGQRDEGSEDLLAKSTNAAVKIQAYVRGHLARQKSIYRINSETNLTKSSSANDENNNDEKKVIALPPEASENFRKTFVETISESDHDEAHPVNENIDQTKAKELTRAFVEYEQQNYQAVKTSRPNKVGSQLEGPESERGVMKDEESELSKEKSKMENLGKSKSPVFGRSVDVDAPAIEKLALAQNNVENAAVKIQSLWRGHVIRRHVKNLELKDLQKPTECDDLPGDRLSVKDLVKAATVIQALFRGYSVRKHFKNEKMETTFRREKSFEEKLPTVLEVEDDGDNEDGPKEKTITIHEDPIPHEEKAESKDDNQREGTESKESQSEETKKLSDEEVLTALENVPVPPRTPDILGRSSAGALRRSETALKKNLSVSDLHAKNAPEEAFDLKETRSHLDQPSKAEESDIHEDIAEIANSIKEDVVKLKQVLGDDAIPSNEEGDASEVNAHLLELAGSMKEDAQKLQETLSNETGMDQAVNKSEEKAIPNEDFGKVKKPITLAEDGQTTNKSEEKPKKTIPNDSFGKESTTSAEDNQTTNKSEKSIPNEDPELLSRPVSKESTTSADSVDTVIFNDQKPRKKPTRADTILPENYIQDNLETSMQNLSLDQFDEVSSGSSEDKQAIPMEEEAPPKMPQRQEEPPVKHQVKFRVLGELKEDSGENDASERERRLGEVQEQSSDLVTDVIDTAAKKIQKFFRRHRGKGRRKSASTTEILKQTQSTFSSSEDDKDAAATAIQKTYRGYRVRRDLQSRKTPAGEDDVEYDKKEKEIDREITNLLKSITAPVRRAFSADAKEKVEAKEKVTTFKEEGDAPNYVYIPLRDYSSEESQELAMPSKSRAGSKVDIYMPHFAASEDASNDSRTESHSEGTSTSKNVTTSEYSAEDISDKCKSIENKMEFEQKGVQIEEAPEKPTDKEEPKLQGSRQAEPVEEDERGAEFEEVKSTAKLAETQQGMKEEDKVLEGRMEQKMVDEAQKPPKEEKQTNEGIANAAITQYINSLIEPIKQAFSADKNKADRKSAIDKDVRPSVKDEGPIYIPLRDYSDESPEKPSRDELGFQSDRKKREVLEQEPAQKIVEEPNGKAQEQSSNKAPDVSHLELKPIEIEEMRHAEHSKRAQSLNDLEAQILNELGLTEGEPGCKNEANFKEDVQSKTVSEEVKVSKDQPKNNGAENDDKAKVIPQKQFTIEKLNGMEEGSGKKEEIKSVTEFQGQSLTQSAEEKILSGNSTVKEEALIQNDPNAKLPKTDVSPPNEVSTKRSLPTSHGMNLGKSEGWKDEGDRGNEMEANPKDHKVENHVVKENADVLTMETKEKVQVVLKNESKENNEEQERESASVDGKSISRETDDDSIQDLNSKKGNINEPSNDNQAIDEVILPSKTDQVASSTSKENERNLEENSIGKVKEEREDSSKESDSAIGQKEEKAEDASGKPMELEEKLKLEENFTEAVEEEKRKGKKAHGDSPKEKSDPVVMGVSQKDEARSTDKRGEDGENQLELEEDAKIPESCLEKEESTSNGNEKLIVKAQDDGESQREKASELSEMKQNEDFANSKGNVVKNLKEEKATDSEQPKQSVEALTLVPNKTEEALDEKPSLEETLDISGESLTNLESQVIPALEGENKDNQEENKNAQGLDLGMPTGLSTEDAIKNETVRNEKSSGDQDGENENRHKDEATATQTNEGEKNVKDHMNTLKSIESGPSITKEEETSFDPKLESITDGENSQQQIVDDGNSEYVQILVEDKVKNEREHNQNLKAEETKVDIKEGAADKTENVKVNLTPEGGHVDVKPAEIKPTNSDTHLDHPIQKGDQQSKIEAVCEKRVATALGEERKEDLTQPSQKGDWQSKIEETREEEREGQRSLGLAEDEENAHSIQQGKVGEIGVKGVATSLEEEKSSDLTQPTQKGDQENKIEETREEEKEQRSLDLTEDKEGSHSIQKEEQQSKSEETHEEGREEQKSSDLTEVKENSHSVQKFEQQSKIIGETEAEERVIEEPLDLAAEDDVKGKDLLKGELETSDLTSKKGHKIEESYMSTIKEEEEVNKGEAASQKVQKDPMTFDQKDSNDDKADEETSAKSTENGGTIKDIDAAQRNEKLEDEGYEIQNAENRTRDDLAKKESKIEEDLKQKSVTENLAQAQTLLRSSEANDETLKGAKDDVLDGSVKLEGDGGGKTDDVEETKMDLTKEENNNGKQEIATGNLAQAQTLLQTPEEAKGVEAKAETDVLAQGVKLEDKGDDLEESAKVESPNLTSAVTSQLIEENKSIALTESIQADELVMEEKAKESEPDEQRTEIALPYLHNLKIEKEESPAGQLGAVVKEEGKKFGESFDLEATPEIAQPKNDVKEFTEEKKTTSMESKVGELPNQPTIEGASQQLMAERLPEGVGQEPTLLEKSRATEEVKEDEGKKSKVETRTEEDVSFLKDENATMLGDLEGSTPVSSTESREIQPSIDGWPKEKAGEEDKLQGAAEDIQGRTAQVSEGPKTAGKEEERQDVATVEGLVQATQISESESPSNGAEKTPGGSMEPKESELLGGERPEGKAGVRSDGEKTENIPEGTEQVTDAPKTAGKEEERQDVAYVDGQVQATQIFESKSPIKSKGPSNGAEKTPGDSMESKESKHHGDEGPKEEAGVQGDPKNQLDAVENIPGGIVQVTDALKTTGKEEEGQDVASVERQVQATQISESESPIRGKGPSNGGEKTSDGSMKSKERKHHGDEGPKEEAGVQGDPKNQLGAVENIPGGTVQVTDAPKTTGKEEERQDVASVEGQVQATQISESESPIKGKSPSNGAEKTPGGSMESKEIELHGDEKPKEDERTVQFPDGPKTMSKEEERNDVASVERLAEGTQMFESDSSVKGNSSSSCVVKTSAGSMESKESELHGDERPKEKERTVQVTNGSKTMGKEEERDDVASAESLVQATQISIKGQGPSNFAEEAPAGSMKPKDLHTGERPKEKAGEEDKLRGDRENQSGATGSDGPKAAEEIFESGISLKGETERKENELLSGDWPKEVVEGDKQQGDGGGQSNTSENIPKATEVTEEESVDSLDATIKLEDRAEAAEIFKPESTEASESVPEEKSAPFYLHQDSYSKSPTTLQEKAFAEALKNASSDVGKTLQTEEGERLLHSGEFHDSIPLKVASEKAARDAAVDPRPPPLLAHSGELHDNIIPLVLQMNDAPGTEAVTSRREASVSVGAQASDKDVSAAREDAPDTTQQHSQPSSGMDTEKRNNSAIVRKSMEAEAATKIQASFRGYQVRKQLKGRNTGGAISSNRRSSRRKSSGRISDSKRAALQNKTNPSQLEQESATKIQAGIRGFLVRRRQKKEKKSNKKTPESG